MRFTTPRVGARLARIVMTAGLVAGVLTLGAPPAGAINVSSVSAGAVHACVRTAAGAALCWGYNDVGMVGDGTRIDRRTPVQVKGLGSNVADVQAVWDHSCALTNAGSVKCWGHNGDGELGDGSLIKRLEPVQVDGLTGNVQQISLGFDSGCALLDSGSIKCWGYNGSGQLGDGTRHTRRSPVLVQNITDAVQISAGWDHTCAVRAGGHLMCWGDNKFGEVGNGNQSDQLLPVDVSGLTSGVAAVSAGFDQTCALLTTGSVKCWGDNKTGELGDGTTTSHNTPVNVSGLSNVDSISAGANHTCAVTAGAAKCWGANESGEIGDGTHKKRTTPVGVYRAASGISSISAGGFPGAGMTCLNTNGGAVRCFGANHGVHRLDPIDSHGGQLGDGTTTDRLIPTTVRKLGGSSPPNFRPDGVIGKTATAGFVGNNIYNTTGNKQTRTKAIAPGGTRRFYIHVQNDANVTDSFFLAGGGTGGGFAIDYSSGGHSVRGKVVSGEFWFTLNAGQEKTIVMTVKADGGIGSNAKRRIKIITRSAGDSAKVDVVKAVVHT
jgi:regulator of chromosome condensation (RCC1) repeat-containing protein/Regulator of Chromosome Condensation (RCC1) repeat protein